MSRVPYVRKLVVNQAVFAQCVEHFNEPVIDGFRVVRLIGYGQTAADTYYVYQCPERGVYWSSAVGGPIALDKLKGQSYARSTAGEDWDDLVRLDHFLSLNGVPKADDFLVDLRPDDFEGQVNPDEEAVG